MAAVALARVVVEGEHEVSVLVGADPDTQVQRLQEAATAWLWPFAGATAVSAALELGVLRVFTRTIIHIPGASSVSPALSLIAEVGRLAYYVTCVLLVGLLVLVVVRSTLATSRTLLVAAVIVIFGITAAGARAGIVGDGTVAVGVLIAAVTLGAIAATSRGPVARLPIAAFSVAFTIAALDALVAGGVLTIGRAGGLRTVGETLAVIAAIVSPLALRARPDRRSIMLGGGAGVLVIVLLVANSSTTNILMLWNLGLTGIFPWIVYGAAVGSLTCTVAALMRSGGYRGVVVVALLIAGGIGLHSTYQSGLVIAGLALLGLGGEGRGETDDQVPETGGVSWVLVSMRRTKTSAIASRESELTSRG